MTEVVRFPTRRRAIDRLGLDRPQGEEEIARLDAEMRRLETAIRTLSAQRTYVLQRYRAAVRAKLDQQAAATAP